MPTKGQATTRPIGTGGTVHGRGVLDPEPPTPTASAMAPCGFCGGSGEERVRGKSGARITVACQLCDRTGQVENGEEPDGDDGRDSAPYDHPARRRRNPLGLTDRSW